MVSTNKKFNCFFFQIPKVVDDGCIKIRFDAGSSEVLGIFALPPFSKFGLVLRPIVFVEFNFPNSI